MAVSAPAQTGYVVGLSAAADTSDGLGASALLDVAFTDRFSATLSAGLTQASGFPEDVEMGHWRLGLRRDFGPLGVEASFGEWGDPDEFESDDWSTGLFADAGPWRFAVSYLRRDFDITFRAPNFPDRRVVGTARADGVGLDLGYRFESDVDLYVATRRYDYNRDVSRLGQFEVLRRLTPTALTLTGSLLDATYSAGIDVPRDDQILSFNVSRSEGAVDGIVVDSVAIGWLLPLSLRSDLDLGLGISDEDGEQEFFFSLLFLFYGGYD